jgi:hypothetical protein
MKILLLASVLSFGGAGVTEEWIGGDPIIQHDLRLPICADSQHLNYSNNEWMCGK